ncbi:MAG: hypothetical protein U0V87_17385 [Acidobacteriota bacterium]
MIPALWSHALAAYLWQVFLHSAVAAVVVLLWSRAVPIPSGRTRRRLLVGVLVIPMLTAAIPGRAALPWRAEWAWLDGARLLALPIVGGVRVHHLVLISAILTVGATLWQEVVPVLHKPRRSEQAAPAALVDAARAQPGWSRCDVTLLDDPHLVLASAGWPWHPRLLISTSFLTQLTSEQRAVALRHESAHWIDGRWAGAHLLFLLRLAQLHNPVALWCFREYLLEVEVDCDRRAVQERDVRPLVSTLLLLYEQTSPRDAASRSALRWRVAVLLGDRPHDDAALPLLSQAVAAALLLMVLPWLV